jgi:Asp-tRNA(Asn)/Glu-tRNA(Gln) amidotransferase A subunit family amidase
MMGFANAQPILQELRRREATIMNTPDKTPAMRSYFPAAEKFADGGDSPRAFLERCLESLDAWEPVVGAFVTLNLEAARVTADQSTKRWRKGNAISPIDGMPVGIKDIIETADMPTQNGSPLFDGFCSERDAASVAALREAGAVIIGKTVTTEFASTAPRGTKNPWDTARTPGGSSSGSAAAVAMGAISAGIGTQVLGSILRPSSFCGCFGFKPTVGAINRGGSYDGLSQSTHGPIAATLPEAWRVAWEISQRAGGDPGFPGLYGRPEPPPATRPEKLAFIETDGWEFATDGAKQALEEVIARLRAAGIVVATRTEDDRVAAGETAIHGAKELSIAINTWESRWPLNTYKTRDAGKLSEYMLDRSFHAESMMTLDDYRCDIGVRDQLRAAYLKLAIEFDACITLAAPGAAPVGLGWTGDAVFNAPASLLGIPALSLPVLSDEGLPLGLQLMGFAHRDAALFGTAAWVMGMMT